MSFDSIHYDPSRLRFADLERVVRGCVPGVMTIEPMLTRFDNNGEAQMIHTLYTEPQQRARDSSSHSALGFRDVSSSVKIVDRFNKAQGTEGRSVIHVHHYIGYRLIIVEQRGISPVMFISSAERAEMPPSV